MKENIVNVCDECYNKYKNKFFAKRREVNGMPSQGEIIKELAEKLERQVIIDALSKIQSMEELQEYIEKLRAKNE